MRLVLHDEHPNWRRLTGWDQAETLITGVSAEWDALCREEPDLQDIERMEIWSNVSDPSWIDVCGHARGRDVFRRRCPWYDPARWHPSP